MKTMNNKWLAVAGIVTVMAITSVQAIPVTGSITFNGTANLDTGSAGTATAVIGWHGSGGAGLPYVADSSGDFSTVLFGTGVTITSPWSFNSGPIAGFWTVGGFTFDLIGSAIVSQGSGTVAVNGTGTISGNSYSATVGTWSFSTQDPSAGTPARFSFSAATGAVPDGGTTVVLLGAALSGLAWANARRKK